MSASSEPNDRFVAINVGAETLRLPRGDALRLARAIRNLVKEELAAMDAANKGKQT